MDDQLAGLSTRQRVVKRSFDIVLSLAGLTVSFWLIAICFLVATASTRSFGLFFQNRIGRDGRTFRVIKIKTMRGIPGVTTTVTTLDDMRITPSGGVMRRWKLDELPQLWNVFSGDMSFVGPRPDMPGFADKLTGSDRLLLTVQPGITGPATLKYRDEEALLAAQDNPEVYNRDVLFPDKVAINCDYVRNWSFQSDVVLIMTTLGVR
ncbi:sugar transferase [Myxococcota bacterium]|nr:sugar transferase [Myxococcota bacterium]